MPGQVTIASGGTHAIDLAIRLLLDPDDRAWIEEPTFPNAFATLVAAGARPGPGPGDEAGLPVQAGKASAPHARLAMVTPSHHTPLGVTMTLLLAATAMGLLGVLLLASGMARAHDHLAPDTILKKGGRELQAGTPAKESYWLYPTDGGLGRGVLHEEAGQGLLPHRRGALAGQGGLRARPIRLLEFPCQDPGVETAGMPRGETR